MTEQQTLRLADVIYNIQKRLEQERKDNAKKLEKLLICKECGVIHTLPYDKPYGKCDKDYSK